MCVLTNPHHFLDHLHLGCTQRECTPNEINIDEYRNMFESRISAGATEKRPGWENFTHKHGRTERYCELANKKVEQLYKVSSPFLDDHQLKQEELESVGELSEVCSQIVLKCLYLARIGPPDILWSVNELARSVTQRTQACDRRLARLISYNHHTNDFRQHCHVGNTALHCRLGLFQDSDFAGDLEDSKSTSGGVLCISGSRTFVPVSWMCKKQTSSVSHSSTESEIISLDAGLRMDGLSALDLWDMVIEVLRSTNNKVQPKHASHQETGQFLIPKPRPNMSEGNRRLRS